MFFGHECASGRKFLTIEFRGGQANTHESIEDLSFDAVTPECTCCDVRKTFFLESENATINILIAMPLILHHVTYPYPIGQFPKIPF